MTRNSEVLAALPLRTGVTGRGWDDSMAMPMTIGIRDAHLISERERTHTVRPPLAALSRMA